MVKKLPKPEQEIKVQDYLGNLETIGKEIDLNLSAGTEYIILRIPKGNGRASDMALNIRRQIETLFHHRNRVVATYEIWQQRQWEETK